MGKRRSLPPLPGKNHADPLSYWERYQQSGQESQTVDSYYVHVDACGWAWCLSDSAQPPKREDEIAFRMATLNILHIGTWPDVVTFSWYPSREEAEQKCPRSAYPHEQHEPPTEAELRRPICSAIEPWPFRKERRAAQADHAKAA